MGSLNLACTLLSGDAHHNPLLNQLTIQQKHTLFTTTTKKNVYRNLLSENSTTEVSL